MQAITFDTYGSTDVLRCGQVPTPTPGPGEVLVRVAATTVTAVDATFRAGQTPAARLYTGLRRPRIPVLGTELAGEVAAVGSGVTRFRVGDRVFGAPTDGVGAHAQYVAIPETGVLCHVPDGVELEQAAAVCNGALTALPFLRDHGRVGPGARVLINGAAGSIGTAAVQLAKKLGAHVTAVASAPRAELLRSLGADEVIDYRARDFTAEAARYDVIFDTVGKSSFGRCRRALRPGGRYLNPVLGAGLLASMLWTRLRGGKRALFAATGLRPEADRAADLRLIAGLLSDGRLRTVIDARYPFSQVADAYRRVESGHKAGNILLLPPNGAAPAVAA
ncbi:MAG: NAD(P)-dependent alcohol dehydrogenase [Myxococcales bacterium]|jgi:NADPH:quinone reductase-like Zn-dependent oxidoreductase